MASPRNLTFLMVHVEWVDSNSCTDWEEHHEARDLPVATCHTVGMLVRDEPDRVVVATNYDATNDRSSQTIAIPKGCISRRWTLNYSI